MGAHILVLFPSVLTSLVTWMNLLSLASSPSLRELASGLPLSSFAQQLGVQNFTFSLSDPYRSTKAHPEGQAKGMVCVGGTTVRKREGLLFEKQAEEG